jgi:predicted GH43/DUF377 family glycosyl hydrolase
MQLLVVPLIALACTATVAASVYDVVVESHAAKPVLSSEDGGGGCLVFNPSVVPATEGSPEGLFLRRCCGETCRGHGRRRRNDALDEYDDAHAERIGFAKCDLAGGTCEAVDDGFNLDPFADAEDPRVLLHDGIFYNFYYRSPPLPGSNCTDQQCTVQLSKSTTPLDASSWKPVATLPWHRNGCCLPSANATYCMWGEGPGPFPGLGMSVTSDLSTGSFEQVKWSSDDNVSCPISDDGMWLLPLGNEREEIKLEAGTHLHPLSDGNAITFYAAATPGWVANGNYTAGWLILDGSNPAHVLQRSIQHVLIPTFEYETLCDGRKDCPYVGERNNVIFLSSAVRLNSSLSSPSSSADRFRLYFGAGDGNVGTAVVHVDISP